MYHFLSRASIILFMFLLIYNISFLVSPSLSTARLALLAVAPVIIIKNPSLFKRSATVSFPVLVVWISATIWSLILYYYNGWADNTQVSRLIHFFMYSLLGAHVTVILCNGERTKFLAYFGAATALQAVLVFWSFFSEELRDVLAQNLVQSGNIPLTSRMRSSGLSNSSGAALSLIQAYGVLACLAVADIRRRNSLRVSWILMALLVMMSTVMIGRTGLYLSVLLFMSYLARWLFFKRSSLLLIAIFLVSAGLVTVIFIYFQGDGRAHRVGSWAGELFVHGDVDSVKGLASMPIPELTTRTIVGTGMVAGAHGNISGHDSGYIQTYYAMGLVMSFVFYFVLFCFVAWNVINNNKGDRLLMALAAASMVVAEVKEPFIFKYVIPFFVFALIFSGTERKRKSRAFAYCYHNGTSWKKEGGSSSQK